jgi:hypothetical protein
MVDVNSVYALSEDVVTRDIGGETVIVPITGGIGDMEDELYTINDSGQAILSMLDGKKSLREIVMDLSSDYDASVTDITSDVVGFVSELYRRKILVEVC